MAKSSYVDTAAIIQIIGNVFNDPTILDDTDKYIVTDKDFVEDFHRFVFGAIYNIHMAGSGVTLDAIIDFFAGRPKYEAVFKTNKGIEYLQEVSTQAKRETFNYYYNRLKKFSLLRAYESIGMDVTFLYDPYEVLNAKKRQEQEEWLDSTPINKIAEIIDNKISSIREEYVDDDLSVGYQAGDGILDLIERYKQAPEVGIPLYGRLINTVTRGARLRKLYLRSGHTGVGKTRTMAADACNFACNRIWGDYGWQKNGTQEPTLYIVTEQDKDEVQTMCLAFVSNVDEDHILNGEYLEGEEERVIEAGKIIASSPLWIEEIPDFSIQDIENKIKKNIRERGIKYVMFDYIHTSLKILEEITKRTNGVKLREDNILFMLSARLKDIANQYGVFIMTATQLNGDYKNSETPDQNLLRGAKSIADKVDVGMILLSVTPDDLVALEPILSANPNFKPPTIKLSIYKNRRGSYKGVFLWCDANLGTCRVNPQFCTNWRLELINMKDARIIVDEGPAAWDEK